MNKNVDTVKVQFPHHSFDVTKESFLLDLKEQTDKNSYHLETISTEMSDLAKDNRIIKNDLNDLSKGALSLKKDVGDLKDDVSDLAEDSHQLRVDLNTFSISLVKVSKDVDWLKKILWVVVGSSIGSLVAIIGKSVYDIFLT